MRQKRSLLFLLLSIVSLFSLTYIIYFIPPHWILDIRYLKLDIAYVFFPLLFLFLFSTTTYLFKSKKHGLIVALFAVIYLLFRLNNLTHPFFFILLLSLFLTLELLFSYRK